MGDRRGAYRFFVGKREGKRPLERPWRRWKYNIKMYVKKVGWGTWTGLILLRVGRHCCLLWMHKMQGIS
jgi:hypothetical protein